MRRGPVSTTVWLFEPRSHGMRKADTRARNGAPLPGRRPSAHVPHRSASSALCPCGHAASFRRRASSFVQGTWSSAALCLAEVLCVCARCVRRAVRRARAWCCLVAAAVVARCVRGTSSRSASAACGVRGVRAAQQRGSRQSYQSKRNASSIMVS